MYDDDLFSFLNSMGTTTTETEEQPSQTTSYSPQTGYNPYTSVQEDPYTDDYSVTPNYEEQQSYNTTNPSYGIESQGEQAVQSYEVRQMNTPMIIKEAPAVNLIKKRQKIELQARMKIVLAMFSIIVASLMFVVVWNFVSASKLKATFAGKQQEIAQLQESIMGLQNEYTSLSSDEQIKLKAENEGYVEQSSENTINVSLEEVYDEHVITDLPSNWFNDVCDFLSGLFS